MGGPLSAGQLAEFRERGFLVIRDLLRPEHLRPLIDECESRIDAMAAELHAAGRLPEPRPEAPFETRLAQLCSATSAQDAVWLQGANEGKLKTRGMFAIYTAPPLLDVAEQIVGKEVLAHPQFNIRAKLPLSAIRDNSLVREIDLKGIPFHQVNPSFCVHRVAQLSI